jgi:uncharacterized protein (TIGR00255 family)
MQGELRGGQSMTGFSRHSGMLSGGGSFAWELRSVNGKGLDLRFRLPPGLERIDAACRREAALVLSRGTVFATLSADDPRAAAPLVLNPAALEAALAAADAVRRRLGGPPPAVGDILSVRGVLEAANAGADEGAIQATDEALVAGFTEAIRLLARSRREEGAAILRTLGRQVDEIEQLAGAIAADPSRSSSAIRERLAAQVSQLLGAAPGLDAARLHQEAALLAVKADIAEELDRLAAHVGQARRLLSAGEPVGRKLDFLAQEFNRECNTICSKSASAAVTSLGLEMKVVIDRFREQVQNVE